MSMWKPVGGRPLEVDHLGRYRLVAQLGHGGMGTIHLALTSGLGEFRKLLVIKELQRDLAMNDKFVEMFMSEAKLAARLSHPNIVQTVEAGEENGRYFISMEFLDGQPMTELLKRQSAEPALSLGMRLQILCDVLTGLQYAHELCDFDGTPYEIVHRDVNPHNVFVTYHGQVKLVDFGIAKAVDIESLTTVGVFKGKFSYAAPEQVRGEPVDQRSDLFAVGVMLWEAVANRRFAPGLPTRMSLDRRLRGLEPRIREVQPEIDPALAEISDRALAVDKCDRYATAQEFRTALQRYLLVAGETPSESLGALMCTKFAAERTAMHGLIDAATKRDERYQSVIRSLPSPSSETAAVATPEPKRSEGPTLVGDLRRLVDTSRVDDPIDATPQPTAASEMPAAEVPAIAEAPLEWAGRLRARHGPYPWLALALVVGLVGYFWLRPDPSANTSASPSPQLETRTQAATAAPPASDAPAPLALPADPAPPASAASTPEPAPSRPARVWRPRSALASDGGSTRLRPAPGEKSARGDAAGGPAAEQNALPGAAPRPAQPMIGQDLRGLPRRRQRPIDLEDPYR